MALQVYSGAAVSARPLWSAEQRIELGAGCAEKLAGQIPIIRKAECDSINTAVGKLNSQAAAPEGGMYIAYSKVADKHFLLYQTGKEQSALAISGGGNVAEKEKKAGFSVEQRIDLGSLDRVKEFTANNPSIQVLDKAKYNSVNTAVSKLNSKAAVSADAMCIVYSKAADKHFLLYQSGKEQRAMDISGTGSVEENKKGLWSVEQRIDLGSLDRVKELAANNPSIQILDKAKFNSVNTAVSKLNSKAEMSAEAMCIVYSKVADKHFLLYQSGKEQRAMDISGTASVGVNTKWSVEQRVDLGPLDRVKSIAASNPSIQILDKAKCDSLNTAVSKLNSSAAAPGAMYIAYSKVAQQHFLLYQTGQEQKALGFSVPGSVENKSKAQWSAEQRIDLGSLDRVKGFAANNPGIQVLDKATYNSVNTAVSKLNAKAGVSSDAMYIVFSKAADKHFLLYQSGQEQKAMNLAGGGVEVKAYAGGGGIFDLFKP